MRSYAKHDYSKLRGRIVEKFGTMTRFADAMGVSRCALSEKFNDKASFTAKNIEKICKLLDINTDEIGVYFFKQKV